MADQGQWIGLFLRRTDQHGFEAARPCGRHRDTEVFAIIILCGGGPRGGKSKREEQPRRAPHCPLFPRRSQRWKFALISDVSGTGLRVR